VPAAALTPTGSPWGRRAGVLGGAGVGGTRALLPKGEEGCVKGERVSVWVCVCVCSGWGTVTDCPALPYIKGVQFVGYWRCCGQSILCHTIAEIFPWGGGKAEEMQEQIIRDKPHFTFTFLLDYVRGIFATAAGRPNLPFEYIP